MMGRTRIIEREEAVKIAMHVFWEKGYHQSSIEDLQKAMGLKRGSFYFLFSDKNSLFQEVLELYRLEIVTNRKDAVLRAKNTKSGIKKFFKILIDHSVENQHCPGCLNTNTATELGSADADITAFLGSGLLRWEKFWFDYLKQGQDRGDISKELNIGMASRQLILLTQGLNVVGKVKPDKKYLTAMVNAGLYFLK